MDTGAQELAYIFRRGDPLAKSDDKNLSKRIRYSQGKESDAQLERRVLQFVSCRNAISECATEYKLQHLQRTIEAVRSHIDQDRHIYGELPTSLLLSCSEIVPKLKESPDWRTIVIRSNECVNLKTTVKLIVNRFTGYEEALGVIRNVDRRLTYDFDVLGDWMAASPESISRLIVFIEDTDSFSSDILNGLISQMHSYLDLLPFHVVMNLSMPPILLEDRLTRENIASISPKYFSGLPHANEFVQSCMRKLRIVSEKLEKYLLAGEKSVDETARILRYACLAHFTGNPFASLVRGEEPSCRMIDLFSRLPSYRGRAKDLVDETPETLLNRCVVSGENIHGVGSELGIGLWGIREVFNPTYRPLLEGILTEPDMAVEGPERESTPICVLYQLYRESSIYINIFDFYVAFQGLLERYAEPWSDQTMALFLEATAAMKFIGILRDCKRKFECVEKVSWKDI